MTREEFIQQLLLAPTDSMDIMKEKLAFYDKEAGYGAEHESVIDFINKSKNYTAFQIITPFGEFPIAVDKKAIRELSEWVRSNTGKYGFGLGDIIKR